MDFLNKNLTVIILTYNEENNIIGLLESIKSLGVNIFVVDSYSTDSTTQILDEYSVNWVQNPFKNYSVQRNWAIANNPFKTEWVLNLDAGERLTNKLANWIVSEFESQTGLYDGFMFSRRTEFMGKWIKYGGHYPNYHLRLFKVSKGKCEDKVYDQHFVVEGKKVALPKGFDIVDTVMDNLNDFTISHSKWSIFEAIEIINSEKDSGDVEAKLFGNPIERTRWLKNNIFQKTPLFVRSLFYFLYRYIIRLGFLDGQKGLIFHFLQGFWFRFLVDANVIYIKDEMKKGKELKLLASKLGANELLKQD